MGGLKDISPFLYDQDVEKLTNIDDLEDNIQRRAETNLISKPLQCIEFTKV